ncbi:uncharacterized protein LOC123880986 isoform X2 [Maniola jurtina]|nr:uncharacterized protein LOC123880986 isoform X2 [Maniola jurtina]
MEPRARASGEQFSALLEYMESHGDLSKPQPGAQGRLRADRSWQELANLLNSIGGGVNKTPEKWKKVWADWKSKTKKKALMIRRHASGTGGGPSRGPNLTALETRLLGIIGALAVEGHEEIDEQGFDGPPAVPGTNDGVEDGRDVISQPPSSPPLPLLVIPSPTRSPINIDQPTAPDTSHTYAPSLTPPPSPQPSRHRREGARRRRTLTPFDRAAREFAAIEQRRLQLEERRVANEGRRIEADNNRTSVLNRLADIAESFLQHYLQSRGQTE